MPKSRCNLASACKDILRIFIIDKSRKESPLIFPHYYEVKSLKPTPIKKRKNSVVNI